jgi:AcrR family transcriptional regulator
MSGNSAKKSVKPARKPARKMDSRVRRTRDGLGDALIELMHEKDFEAITVQHVLDRAGVSRSTFYTHYRDKDDLFLSDAEDFLEMMASVLARRAEQSKRVAAVRELFDHVGEWHKFHGILASAGKLGDFQELGQGCFARGIEQRLSHLDPASAPQHRAARAQMLAGALFSLLSWWLKQGRVSSPEEMDELFHRMVWSK